MPFIGDRTLLMKEPGDRLLEGRIARFLVIYKNPSTGRFIGLNQNGVLLSFSGLKGKSDPTSGDVIQIQMYARGDKVVADLESVVDDVLPIGKLPVDFADPILDGQPWYSAQNMMLANALVESGQVRFSEEAIIADGGLKKADIFEQRVTGEIELVRSMSKLTSKVKTPERMALIDEFYDAAVKSIQETAARVRELGEVMEGPSIREYISPNGEIEVSAQHLHSYPSFDGYKYQLSVRHPRYRNGVDITVGLYKTEKELIEGYEYWLRQLTGGPLLPEGIKEFDVPAGVEFTHDVLAITHPGISRYWARDDKRIDPQLPEMCEKWCEAKEAK